MTKLAVLDKRLEKALDDVIKNPKTSTQSRLKAIQMLAKHVSTKRRYFERKMHQKRNAEKRQQERELAEKKKEQVRDKNIRASDGMPKPKGKKEQKRATAAAVATTSDEWSDLIPKAKVISLEKRRGQK